MNDSPAFNNRKKVGVTAIAYGELVHIVGTLHFAPLCLYNDPFVHYIVLSRSRYMKGVEPTLGPNLEQRTMSQNGMGIGVSESWVLLKSTRKSSFAVPKEKRQNFFLVDWNINVIFPFSWQCHNPNWSELHHFSEG